jgi:hypothetical protein
MTTNSKLQLVKETVRVLTPSQIDGVDGGCRHPQRMTTAVNCTAPAPHMTTALNCTQPGFTVVGPQPMTTAPDCGRM